MSEEFKAHTFEAQTNTNVSEDTDDDFKSVCDAAVDAAEAAGGDVFARGNTFSNYIGLNASYTGFSTMVVPITSVLYGYWGSNGTQYFRAANETSYQAVRFKK